MKKEEKKKEGRKRVCCAVILRGELLEDECRVRVEGDDVRRVQTGVVHNPGIRKIVRLWWRFYKRWMRKTGLNEDNKNQM